MTIEHNRHRASNLSSCSSSHSIISAATGPRQGIFYTLTLRLSSQPLQVGNHVRVKLLFLPYKELVMLIQALQMLVYCACHCLMQIIYAVRILQYEFCFPCHQGKCHENCLFSPCQFSKPCLNESQCWVTAETQQLWLNHDSFVGEQI